MGSQTLKVHRIIKLNKPVLYHDHRIACGMRLYYSPPDSKIKITKAATTLCDAEVTCINCNRTKLLRGYDDCEAWG